MLSRYFLYNYGPDTITPVAYIDFAFTHLDIYISNIAFLAVKCKRFCRLVVSYVVCNTLDSRRRCFYYAKSAVYLLFKGFLDAG